MHFNHEHVSGICFGSYCSWTKFLNLFKSCFSLSKILNFSFFLYCSRTIEHCITCFPMSNIAIIPPCFYVLIETGGLKRTYFLNFYLILDDNKVFV